MSILRLIRSSALHQRVSSSKASRRRNSTLLLLAPALKHWSVPISHPSKDMVTYLDNSHSSRQSRFLVATDVLLRRSGQRLHTHTRASQCKICTTLTPCAEQIATSTTTA